MISTILLAFCLSIDSLGIGFSYGLKKINIPFLSQIILFIISIFLSFMSMLFGSFLSNIFPIFFSKLIGSLILFFMGILIVLEAFKKNVILDFDNSNSIDYKEAVFLGFALSSDSISVGIGSGILGLDFYFLPILISFFHFVFLFTGLSLGKNFSMCSKKLSSSFLALLSGIILIIMGILKLI